jgi:hypothetical protein
MANKAKERKRADLIFDQWRSSLADKDRTHASLLDNFSELFDDLYYANIDFDLAEEYLKDAVTAHLPSKYVVKQTYKRKKGFGLSEQEFYDDWKRLITDRAKQAFFFRYPLPEPENKPEETGTGSMSKDEYMKQRRYANSFPSVDLSKIRAAQITEDDEDDVSFSMADLGE